jgi:hypothetical protein
MALLLCVWVGAVASGISGFGSLPVLGGDGGTTQERSARPLDTAEDTAPGGTDGREADPARAADASRGPVPGSAPGGGGQDGTADAEGTVTPTPASPAPSAQSPQAVPQQPTHPTHPTHPTTPAPGGGGGPPDVNPSGKPVPANGH